MLTEDLVLGSGILDSALYLTQYSIIKELAPPADRRGSHKNDRNPATFPHKLIGLVNNLAFAP